MAATARPPFGVLLNRYRLAARLTQEELAERAALSARAISDLERGVRRQPHPLTVQQLAAALGLSPSDRALFEEAARPPTHPSVDDPLAASGRPRGHFLGAEPRDVLVAREEELARLSAILAAVAGGTGQLVLLAGELGAGKTRLAQEVMVAALQQGFVVGSGRCYQGESPTPYAPVLEALDELAADTPVAVRTEVQQRRHEVQEMLRATVAGHAGNAESGDQRPLFAAVANVVLTLAQNMPVAVLLDDLHWADAGTVRLLVQLARATHGARVLLLGTARDVQLSQAHPLLAQALQDLSRERLLERLSVRRLVPEETAALVAALMGQREVSEELAAFIHRRSKGNPRFVEQLVRALGGRLQLRREIGAGAMGRVFEALDASTARTVAAKLMLTRGATDVDTLLRFQQEGAILAALSHPHIVRVYDTFVEEHASCIIMELLDGPSLGHLLRDGPLPLPRAKRLALQVADALAYAHAQGIVHRDIKPDNVMVVGDDQVKVTDFGIARLLQPDTSLQTIATTGLRLGTPLYMAPEQIEGKKIDGRTDVYAFGALLYHMVTGRPPFAGGEALAVAVRHLHEEPAAPSTLNPAVPADWDALILTALAKEPARRFQSAKEMAGAITALGEDAGAARRTGAAAPSREQRRRVLTATGLLSALLAVVVAVALRVHPTPIAPPTTLSARLDRYLSGLAAHGQWSGTVLVARQGTIVLEKGYGLADRAHGIPNTPDTRYPVGGLSASLSVLGTLQLIQRGHLAWQTPICRYLAPCPASWRPLTVRMVLDGTAHLPDYSLALGRSGQTTHQSLAGCQATPLDGAPGASVDYQDCDSIVLGALIERVTGLSWGRYVSQAILAPVGMRHSGRLTDALARSARVHDYDGPGLVDPNGVYDDIYATYTTAHDVYAYDTALLAGKLLAEPYLKTLMTPRTPRVPLDPRSQGIDGPGGLHPARGYLAPLDPGAPGIGLPRGFPARLEAAFAGRVVYTVSGLKRYRSVNLRLPGAGVSVVMLGNDDRDDLADVALHLAVLVVGRHRAPVAVSPARAVQATVALPSGVVLPLVSGGVLWAPLVDTGKLVRVDTATDRVTAVVTVTRQPGVVNGSGPAGVVRWQRQIWTTDFRHNAIVRIDPTTGRVLERVVVGIQAGEPVVAGDTAWMFGAEVPNGPIVRVVRVDLRAKKVVASLRGVGEPFGLLPTPGAVWISDHASGHVLRLDPATNRVVARIKAGSNPQELAFGAGALWVANGFGHYLTRVDPATNRVVATIPLDRHGDATDGWDWCACHSVIVANGAVWAIAHDTHALVRIDPRTNRVTSTLTLAKAPDGTAMEPFNVASGAGSLWVTADPHFLLRVDPAAMR